MTTAEPTIEHLPIVDSHLHLWDVARLRYPWLAQVPGLARSYGLVEFDAAVQGLKVERAVFVQCDCDPSQARDEVGWVAGLASRDPRIAAIVAFAPLEKGDRVAAELAELANLQAVRGVRRLLQDEADAFCLQPAFVAGVRQLADHDLSFDLCVRHHQLDQAIDLVDRCPHVRFVLNHAAKPDIKGRLLEPWKSRIAAFAERPDTWCKLSGLVTEADHSTWQPAELQPYIEHLVTCFGVDRVMFGSDWPVVTLATGYHRWVEVLRAALSALPAKDIRKIFRDNALTCYRMIA